MSYAVQYVTVCVNHLVLHITVLHIILCVSHLVLYVSLCVSHMYNTQCYPYSTAHNSVSVTFYCT